MKAEIGLGISAVALRRNKGGRQRESFVQEVSS